MREMFKDLSKKNRSYRSFDGTRRISKEELMEFADCARYAPSSVNMQPFQYILSWEDQTNEKIFPLTSWARLLPDFQGPPEGHRPTAYIVICYHTQIGPNFERFHTDIGIVAQTIMLAAAEKGYGGCMIGNYSKEALSSALKLPENLVPALILALGVPDEEIILEDVGPDGNTKYYRKDGCHHVPKRRLEDIIIDAQSFTN